jgi:Tc5 transposase DNA-binding domain
MVSHDFSAIVERINKNGKMKHNCPKDEFKNNCGSEKCPTTERNKCALWHFSSLSVSDKQTEVRNFATHKKVKNIRSAKFVKLEEALLLFIRQMRDWKLPISRALINAKAKEYATELGNISTTPSKTFHS